MKFKLWVQKYWSELPALLEEGTAVAVLMALVAMFGALAASRAGTAEEELTVLENKLSERQVIQLTLTQEYNERFGQLAQFEEKQQAVLNEGQRLSQEADNLRTPDPERAARRDVESQVEFNAARLLRPYLNGTWVAWSNDPKLKPAEIIDRNVARDLKAIGFGSQWVAPGETAAAAQSMWQTLLDEIEAGRRKLIWLTVAVVVFVAALGCMTVAELWRHKRQRMLVMLGLGLLIMLCGLLLTMLVDAGSRIIFLGFFLAFVVFGFVGSRLAPYMVKLGEKVSGRLGFLPGEAEKKEEDEEYPHPGEVEPRLFPGVRVHAEPAQRPFAIQVILLIVLTVLASAIFGSAYSRASTEASRWANRAADHLVEGFRKSHMLSVYVTLGDLATAQEQRMRYQAALQQSDLEQLGFLKTDREKLEEDKQHWKKLVDSQDKYLTGLLSPEYVSSPEQDPRFPSRFLHGDIRRDANMAVAQSDAEDELSLAYHARAERYLVTLTWLAIALYLFGQSLTMMRQFKAAAMLVAFGSFLLAAGTGMAIVQSAKRLPGRSYTEKPECRDADQKGGDASSEAARHYAEGMVQYETREYAQAAREFGCAVEARPAFALANYYLARASESESSPQNGEQYTSLTSEKTISPIAEHEKKAMKGFDQEGLAANAELLGSYGWDAYLLGLIQKKPKLIKEGLEQTQRAVKIDSQREHPYLRFNLGVMEVATGNFSAAANAYKDGLTTPAERLQDGLAVASVNDLEVFLHYCPGVLGDGDCQKARQMADGLKQQLVAAAWPLPQDRTAREGPAPRIENLRVMAAPGGLGWHGKLEELDPQHDVLTVLWYKYEPDWKLWRGLPDLSGEVDFKNAQKDAEGNTHEYRSYLAATGARSCAQQGKYRAEFYVNGTSLGPPVDASNPIAKAFTAESFRDLNLALCRPGEWTERWRPEYGKQFPQFMAGGYTSRDGSQGIFAFEYYFPRGALDEAAKKKLTERSLAYLEFMKFVSGQHFSIEPNTCPAYNQPGMQTALRVKSDDGTVHALARVWASGEGIVHVGVAVHRAQAAEALQGEDVLGPKSAECSALRSMREIYGPY